MSEHEHSGDGKNWMDRLLQQPGFQHIPSNNLQAMFLHMQMVSVEARQTILIQGQASDAYWVVRQGHCKEVREKFGRSDLQLRQLAEGSSFGEFALLADAPCDTSITMLTPGTLMRLSRSEFLGLVAAPLIRSLSVRAAQSLVRAGTADWLDVRRPSEFAKGSLPGARNLPWYKLEAAPQQLSLGRCYIACCDEGSRSVAATFGLAQLGYNVFVLRRGADESARCELPAWIGLPKQICGQALPDQPDALLAMDKLALVRCAAMARSRLEILHSRCFLLDHPDQA